MADSSQLSVPVTALAVAAALAVSPLLAGWTVGLTHDDLTGWWRPLPIHPGRWLGVAIIAAVYAAAGARGTPALAWWLFAVTGTVLALVDMATHRLPARLVGPLAAVETTVLLIAGAAGDQPGPLLRAAVAAAVTSGAYLLLAIAVPAGIGLGDVYLIGISSGLLGWAGWHHVLDGQVLLWLLGALTALGVAIARPRRRSMRTPVPMGPAIITAALIACWI